MKRHPARELTVEEFDEWVATTGRFEEVARAADEEGGPSLSLVRSTERNSLFDTVSE